MAGSRPEVSCSVRAISRSRLMPGKTRTAAFMALASILSNDLDAVILDHRVRQQLVGGLAQQRFGLFRVAAFEFDVEHLALADRGDTLNTERTQCTFDRLALRIENAGFQGNGDASFHRCSQ